MSDRPIVLERRYSAPVEEVWELWTTPAGIESWWGPGGFHVEVRTLDLRPGGKLRYAMIAAGAEQVAFMKNAGMPLVSELEVTYVSVDPPSRLRYTHRADFIPGVDPYDVDTLVELEAAGADTLLRLSIDPMHDDEWTERARMGWESELEKLAALIAGRS